MEPTPDHATRELVAEADGYADLAAHAAAALAREDLARRVAAARQRLRSPEATLVVIGEFKSGKSSLVNGLLGEDAAPVDDDVVTAALTIFRYGEATRALSWAGSEDGKDPREHPLTELPELVTERWGASTAPGPVEVCLSNPLLKRGIVLVDTPGANGIRPGNAAVALGYLQAAHAAIFVTDAGSPLTYEELAFLRRAADVAPTMILALAKTDLFPHWREIHAIDAGLLEDSGLAIPIVPVSSALRSVALDRRDAELNDESGFPELLRCLDERALQGATAVAALGVFDAVLDSLNEMLVATAAGLAARETPSTVQERLDALRLARERLERLRAGNSRFQTMMSDGLSEVVSRVDHQFRRGMRELQRHAEEEIAARDPGEGWQQLAAEIRDRAAESGRESFCEIALGADDVSRRIAEFLSEQDLALVSEVGDAPSSADRPWSPKPLTRASLLTTIGIGVSGLRGAQSGLILFGMLSTLAGFAASGGVLVGIAAAFGGKQVVEERKRQVAARRQEARTAIRQLLDDTEFEVGKALRDLSRELNRRLRDHFTEQIAARIRSCSEAVISLERAVQEDEATRAARIGELRAQKGQVEVLIGRLAVRRASLAGELAL